MKNLKISLVVLLSLIFLCCKKQEIQFIPIKSLDYKNVVNNGVRDFKNMSNFYLIKGYSDSEETEKLIDSFVVKNKSQGWKEFDNYAIIFYKESSETTIENIENNSRIIDRYSNENDLIFQFKWSKGEFMAKYKFKGGQIIEPKGEEIIISPAPPLQDTIK